MGQATSGSSIGHSELTAFVWLIDLLNVERDKERLETGRIESVRGEGGKKSDKERERKEEREREMAK